MARWSGRFVCGVTAAMMLLAANMVVAGTGERAAASGRAGAAAPAVADKAPENLKVLPKEWTRKQVIEFMKGWTGDLGVRCQHCHVGEEGQPFEQWDFPSDEKATKRRAREMYQMLGEINARLGKMKNLHGDGFVPQASCGTCHRGLPRPRRIEDVFEQTRAANGTAAAIAEYRTLRDAHLTRGQYDFSIRPLATQARRQLQANDAAGAQEVMDFAIASGLDGLMARMTLVDIALARDDRAGAIAQLERALTLELNDAEKGFVSQRLQQLKSAEAEPTR